MPVPSQGGAKLAADSPQCNMDSKVEVNKLKKNKQNKQIFCLPKSDHCLALSLTPRCKSTQFLGFILIASPLRLKQQLQTCGE